jgi:hypothetical protein
MFQGQDFENEIVNTEQECPMSETLRWVRTLVWMVRLERKMHDEGQPQVNDIEIQS